MSLRFVKRSPNTIPEFHYTYLFITDYSLKSMFFRPHEAPDIRAEITPLAVKNTLTFVSYGNLIKLP
jgi:hypothetical protein